MSTSSRKRLPVSVSSRRVFVALGVGLAATLVAVLAGRYSDFVQRVENTSYDWRVKQTARPAAADSPVVILDINESTVRALEPHVGRWPWPRAVHAGAIDYLTRAGARVVAYDVLFGERAGRGETVINGQVVSGEASDAAFVESVRAAGNVILLSETTFEGAANPEVAGSAVSRPPLNIPGPVYPVGAGWRRRPDLQLPFAELAAAARGVGHNMLVRDPGSDFARRMLPFVEVHGAAIPSLGTAAALAYRELEPDDVALEDTSLRLGSVRMPLVAVPVAGTGATSLAALLRFRAPVTGADDVVSVFPSYSFFDVLLSNDQLADGKAPAVPLEAFAGKLVFVGTSAAGTFDRYLTPFERGAGGVELHATLADNIIGGEFMRRASLSTDLGLTLASGLAAGASAILLPVGWAIGVVVVLMVGMGSWLTRLVGEGLWVSAVLPGLAGAVALFGGGSWQYFVEGREKRHIKRLFGRYVSRDVIDQLLVDPSLASLGGQRREMTVLFSDIRGFTTASEKGTPEDVVAQLNEYFGSMVEVLFRHQGTLDKFVGDMVMGLFGAPLADPAHADHAVAAALDMIESLDRLNNRWRAEGRPALDIGIGVNTGEMIAGNIGAEAIMSYTVIGDAVNLGARLESLNKEYGTHILISEATRARLTIPVGTREIGAVTVKGKTQAITVHEVTGRASPVRLETELSR